MERRNCSYTLHFPGKCSEQMRKPQRNSAWEARLCVLWQGLRRFLHSAIQPFFPAVCNGKPHRAMETPSVQRKATRRAMES
jgi:hypothetical protein